MLKETEHVLGLIVDIFFGDPEMHNCPSWASRDIPVEQVKVGYRSCLLSSWLELNGG